jgi:hypothetical protein
VQPLHYGPLFSECVASRRSAVRRLRSCLGNGHKNILRASRGLGNRRYLPVRYEDLAERPAETMERIFGFMGIANDDVCHSAENAHVIGNRMASSFSGEIKLDTAWEGALSAADQARICHLAEPLFSHLGYARVVGGRRQPQGRRS